MSMVPNPAPRSRCARGSGRIPRISSGRISPRMARSRRCLASSTRCPIPPKRAELAWARKHGALAVDLERIELRADANPDRSVAIARLEELLPQIGRLGGCARRNRSAWRRWSSRSPFLSRRRRANALALHRDPRGGAVPGLGPGAPIGEACEELVRRLGRPALQERPEHAIDIRGHPRIAPGRRHAVPPPWSGG